MKEAVFPFVKFPGVDTVLGPEMKSTGEVMGIDSDFGRAFAKAQIEAGQPDPDGRHACSSRSAREDRARLGDAMREIVRRRLRGSWRRAGTAARPAQPWASRSRRCRRSGQGSPDVVERIDAGEVDLVINTCRPTRGASRDSFAMRRAALNRGLPVLHDARGAARRGGRDPRARGSARSACARCRRSTRARVRGARGRERRSRPRSSAALAPLARSAGAPAASPRRRRACGELERDRARRRVDARRASGSRSRAMRASGSTTRRAASSPSLRTNASAQRAERHSRGAARASSRRSRRRRFARAALARPLGVAAGCRSEARGGARAARARDVSRTCSSSCRPATTTAPALARIGELEVGLRATFAGEVLRRGSPPCGAGRRRVFQAVLGDGTGTHRPQVVPRRRAGLAAA